MIDRVASSDRRVTALSRLYGPASALRIHASHVAVVGLGGVGSWAAEALARSGVGRLTLIDMDHISESNLNRQIHATEQNIGLSKVQAMKERIQQFNAGCEIQTIDNFVGADNWPNLMSDTPDAVIDACDQSSAKLTMASWSLQSRGIFITVGAAGGKRHAQLVEIDDLGNASHDPLLARLRQGLRTHHAGSSGKKMGVTCVFSREQLSLPSQVDSVGVDAGLNCHGYGSVVTVTATFGQCAAGWVLDQLAQKHIDSE